MQEQKESKFDLRLIPRSYDVAAPVSVLGPYGSSGIPICVGNDQVRMDGS